MANYKNNHDFSVLKHLTSGRLHPSLTDGATREKLVAWGSGAIDAESLMSNFLWITTTSFDGQGGKIHKAGDIYRPYLVIEKEPSPFNPLTVAYENILLSEMTRLWKSWCRLLEEAEINATVYRATMYIRTLEETLWKVNRQLPLSYRTVFLSGNEQSEQFTDAYPADVVFVFSRMRLHLLALLTAIYHSSHKGEIPEAIKQIPKKPADLFPLVLKMSAPNPLPDFGIIVDIKNGRVQPCCHPDCTHRYYSFDNAVHFFEDQTGIAYNTNDFRKMLKKYDCIIVEETREKKSVSHCELLKCIDAYLEQNRKPA